MNNNYHFDSLDIDILKKLQKNARIAYTELAKTLKVSNSLIHQRISKLTKNGAIKTAKFELDPIVLGYKTCAYTNIILKESKYLERVVDACKLIPEIVECVNVTGKYALMVKIYARDNEHLRQVIYNKVHKIKEIEGTNTQIIFNTGFKRSLPLGI